MRVIKGSFLDARGRTPCLLLATGNGVVRTDGALVMGAGAAKALALAYPQTPRVFGAMARKTSRSAAGWHLYGLLVLEVAPRLAVGLFQTKGDWRDPADLGIIAHSARKLAEWLRGHPGWEAHMAFPGVGLGGLREEEVLEVLSPLLEGLPVTLYRR